MHADEGLAYWLEELKLIQSQRNSAIAAPPAATTAATVAPSWVVRSPAPVEA